ncbi:hypothetical protein HOK51_09105 [Candidatus Woesearchaeota archaeon]|jgi:hypothetical protein|nr:hypothetical protein [Candidatus Woesearchaeota archaeon]MBT6519987.1 hypothetical protein [Candidatus Woesearchaeota archaeon]MBT7367812.1 hypothetical protein [Candidatus Woesearchaeota archaeon]
MNSNEPYSIDEQKRIRYSFSIMLDELMKLYPARANFEDENAFGEQVTDRHKCMIEKAQVNIFGKADIIILVVEGQEYVRDLNILHTFIGEYGVLLSQQESALEKLEPLKEESALKYIKEMTLTRVSYGHEMSGLKQDTIDALLESRPSEDDLEKRSSQFRKKISLIE